MRFSRVLICAVTTYLLCGALASAQGDQPSATLASTATVPRLIRIRGAVHDETGNPLSGPLESRLRCMRTKTIKPRSGKKTRPYNWTKAGTIVCCSERLTRRGCRRKFSRQAKHAG